MLLLLLLTLFPAHAFLPSRLHSKSNMLLYNAGGRSEIRRVEFKGLDGPMFQHPLDSRVTKLLFSIPYAQHLVRNLFQAIEDSFLINNLASSILVGPNQMPEIYRGIEICSHHIFHV